ncbi:hypothetical protein [Cryobacterium sp. Y62]|uniref:hypothetical protein n=1 Tax=Cryobacterium sp. Y62 TaxID=2048284 RepID=UPI000CE3423F|nr:hypothetical protein [Cryobacterium sp. Y62]
MLHRRLITPTVFLALVALSGCAAGPVAGPPRSASAGPTELAATTGVYTCDDVATLDTVAGALAPADESMPTPVAATQPGMALTEYAVPSHLVWPAVDLVEREPACTGALKSQGSAMALGVDALDYEICDSSSMDPIWFDRYVTQTARVFTCYVDAAGVNGTSITVGYDLASIVDTMISTPDSQAALPQIALEGAVDGEHAVQICTDTSSYCTVIFSLGQSAYQVESRTDAVAVAVAVSEAIIAQAR